MTNNKKIVYIVALTAVNQALSFSFMIPQVFYYLIMSLGLIFILAQKPVKVNFLAFLFVIVSISSLLLNDVSALFNANERLMMFVLISAIIGPLLYSSNIFLFRNQIFCLINRLLVFFSALSFITYVLGISFPRSGTGANSGLFVHSLMLGPLAAVSLLLLVYVKFDYKQLNFNPKYTKYIKHINLFILLVSMALIISSSRSSIVGAILGLLFFLFKKNQNKIGKFLSTVFKIILLLIVTLPLWYSFTEGIRKKVEISQENDDFAVSRRLFWDARLYEFNSSPMFGIGFASVDTKSPLAIGVNEETGGIEPGSSWMAILAMTGIFGFGTILLLFLDLFIFLWKEKNNLSKSGILGALLVFFSCHMTAEGYFLAAGSFLFFYVWLLLGIIYGYKLNTNIKII